MLFAFQALFEKSSQPQNYIYELNQFYTASRDFRLLAMLPDALTGRTPQQIYPFLANLKVNLLSEIRKEATADEILERLAKVRANMRNGQRSAGDGFVGSIDRTAIGGGAQSTRSAHRGRGSALERAFARKWAEGEVRQMADFLDSLGTIKQPAINEERLKELRELHRLTAAGTDDRLFVAWHLSHALFYSHGLKEEGLTIMQIAIREYQQAHAKGWPANANSPLFGYVDLLEAVKRFGEAENVLAAQIANPINPTQKYALLNRQNQCYQAALREEGQVSLGSGATLYRNLRVHLIEQMTKIDDENHRYQTVHQLLNVFRIAKEKSFAYEKDLRKFAFDQLPAILKSQTNNYGNLIIQTESSLRDLLDVRVALEFLIVRYENYPNWHLYSWQSAWNQLGDRMASDFYYLKQQAGDLEPRLLAIVLAELRRDLETRHSQSRHFYHDNNSYFWSAKADDFARVAEEVYQQHEDSGRSVAYIAEYLYHGLSRYDRAIAMLLAANDKKLLITAQLTLCDYLHERKRYAESIPILQPFVRNFPDVMGYRTRLITAYKHAARLQQMQALLADTDAHFRKKGRWIEDNIALLAKTCLDNDLFAEAAKYYGEVIPLHERTAPNRGIGQGTLSRYYSDQALAYSGLGQTQKAVDAAAAGVIAWGPSHNQRQSALQRLELVLTSAKDLEDYVKTLDQQVQKTGEDSPLIRKKIGQVYAKRNEHKQAIAQLQIAISLQPTDLETHQLLIASFDALGEKQNAIKQTLALLDVDRHNLELYKKLADRVSNEDSLAERAATTIVEAAPQEAENHQALAEVRQQENRWTDAIAEWKEVARLRALEPNGLLKLAAAQIHEKEFAQAQKSLDKLNQTEWPARFRNLRHEISELQQKIPQTR